MDSFLHTCINLACCPSAPKDEYLITDVAYCEQAVIFLKQAKLEQDAGQRRKEDGTLPVSSDARRCWNG